MVKEVPDFVVRVCSGLPARPLESIEMQCSAVVLLKQNHCCIMVLHLLKQLGGGTHERCCQPWPRLRRSLVLAL